MALRLYSDYLSESGEQFRVEIHDALYSGSAHDFDLGSDGCTLTMDGGQNIFQRIIPTTVDFRMEVNSIDVKSFIVSLETATETQNQVLLFRGDVANRVKIFRGFLILEGLNLEDKAQNYSISILAACGLGRMRNIRLDFSNTYPAGLPERVALDEVILLAFSQAKVTELYTDSEVLMFMKMGFKEDSAPTSLSHPLKQYYVSPYAFANDSSVFITCFKALEYVLNSFNSRLYMRQGNFFMQNLYTQKNKFDALWILRRTGIGFVDVTNQYTFTDVLVDFDDNDVYTLEGGGFNFKPEPLVYTLKFSGGGTNNVAKDIVFTQNNFGEVFDLVYLFSGDVLSSFTLAVKKDEQPIFRFDLGYWVSDWVRYEMTIKIDNQYLKGDIVTNLFGHTIPDEAANPLEWTLTPSKVKLYSDGFYNFWDYIRVENLPAVTIDGMISIAMESCAIINYGTMTNQGTTQIVSTPNFESLGLVAHLNGLIGSSSVEYRKVGNVDNSEIEKLDLQLGDVPDVYDSDQRMYYFDGNGDIQLTKEWNGTGENLQSVLLAEAAAIRSKNIRIFNGSIWDKDATVNKLDHAGRVSYRGKVYAFMTIEYNTRGDVISGQWYEVVDADLDLLQTGFPNYPVSEIGPIITQKEYTEQPVVKSNQSVYKVSAQFPEISRIATPIATGDVKTTLTTNALTSKVYKGDSILILDGSGKKETFVLSADGFVGDTVLNIESHTFTHNWIETSVLTTEPKYIGEKGLTINNVVEEYFDDVQTDRILLTVATLPSTAVLTIDEIRRRVKVIVGSNFRYNPSLTKRNHFKIDNVTNEIIFKTNMRGADIDVRILKV